MADEAVEAALVALLARLSEDDGPLTADGAVELYLSRFDGDDDARRAALQRLTRMMLARPANAGAALGVAPIGRTRRAPR